MRIQLISRVLLYYMVILRAKLEDAAKDESTGRLNCMSDVVMTITI